MDHISFLNKVFEGVEYMETGDGPSVIEPVDPRPVLITFKTSQPEDSSHVQPDKSSRKSRGKGRNILQHQVLDNSHIKDIPSQGKAIPHNVAHHIELPVVGKEFYDYLDQVFIELELRDAKRLAAAEDKLETQENSPSQHTDLNSILTVAEERKTGDKVDPESIIAKENKLQTNVNHDSDVASVDINKFEDRHDQIFDETDSEQREQEEDITCETEQEIVTYNGGQQEVAVGVGEEMQDQWIVVQIVDENVTEADYFAIHWEQNESHENQVEEVTHEEDVQVGEVVVKQEGEIDIHCEATEKYIEKENYGDIDESEGQTETGKVYEEEHENGSVFTELVEDSQPEEFDENNILVEEGNFEVPTELLELHDIIALPGTIGTLNFFVPLEIELVSEDKDVKTTKNELAKLSVDADDESGTATQIQVENPESISELANNVYLEFEQFCHENQSVEEECHVTAVVNGGEGSTYVLMNTDLFYELSSIVEVDLATGVDGGDVSRKRKSVSEKEQETYPEERCYLYECDPAEWTHATKINGFGMETTRMNENLKQSESSKWDANILDSEEEQAVSYVVSLNGQHEAASLKTPRIVSLKQQESFDSLSKKQRCDIVLGSCFAENTREIKVKNVQLGRKDELEIAASGWKSASGSEASTMKPLLKASHVNIVVEKKVSVFDEIEVAASGWKSVSGSEAFTAKPLVKANHVNIVVDKKASVFDEIEIAASGWKSVSESEASTAMPLLKASHVNIVVEKKASGFESRRVYGNSEDVPGYKRKHVARKNRDENVYGLEQVDQGGEMLAHGGRDRIKHGIVPQGLIYQRHGMAECCTSGRMSDLTDRMTGDGLVPPGKKKTKVILLAGGKLHTCTLCGMHFTSQDQLTLHMHLHLPEQVLPTDGGVVEVRQLVQCDVCGKQLSSKSSMARHRRIRHEASETDVTDTVPVPSAKVPSAAGFPSVGRRTVARALRAGSPYVCQMCSKSYKYFKHYTTHMSGHEKVNGRRNM